MLPLCRVVAVMFIAPSLRIRKAQRNTSFPVLNSDLAAGRRGISNRESKSVPHCTQKQTAVEEFRQKSFSERLDICSRSSRSNTIDELAKNDNGLSVDLTSVQYEPPIPPPAPAIFSSPLASAIKTSVVSISETIDAAFWSARRVTLAGSITPALTRSPNSPVSALN